MRAEFLKDENNTVWFAYAKDIRVRHLKEPDFSVNIIRSAKVTAEKLQRIKLREKEILEHEMR
jgi:hypothetical protein